jgi:hypothetical protein
MISNTVIRLGTIFFDISKAHCATATKLTPKAFGKAVVASFRRKNVTEKYRKSFMTVLLIDGFGFYLYHHHFRKEISHG